MKVTGKCFRQAKEEGKKVLRWEEACSDVTTVWLKLESKDEGVARYRGGDKRGQILWDLVGRAKEFNLYPQNNMEPLKSFRYVCVT